MFKQRQVAEAKPQRVAREIFSIPVLTKDGRVETIRVWADDDAAFADVMFSLEHYLECWRELSAKRRGVRSDNTDAEFDWWREGR